ncbi:inositol monophosphatase family protein [Sedimentitalea todarodis]|uniref:3'(2'),5'-bisphosphate nucleotidase CysQ n=1 Tax=Sedimentitalea todarodis TaxID=1631240 RepID=A0ABU3VDK9_9RHOB|nr:3'(2'),5'-bisphosphate nucleotidase CysQ [Sedimentitalea todarodis]MDU9004120.1 3'(2'),5'-bisphosphate nucleotidase CysQ [Sedimentitalea todarodis]
MLATDLELLIDAARAAGKIAMTYTGPQTRRWDKPDGTGPVTEADLAVNDLLHDRLRTARPDYGWLSEESEDNDDRLSRERVFIVDPIDGTRSFAEGSSTWAHAIAVAERGIVTAGVIYLPMRDLMYVAATGQGATVNGKPLEPSRTRDLNTAAILANRPSMLAANWRGGAVPKFTRAYRPSLAYRMATVAEGRFDGMITLHPCWEWDVAAGDLILREAGALCTDKTGAPPLFNNAHPTINGLVAGGQDMHGLLCAALRPS